MRTTHCTRCRRRRFLSSKDLCEVSFSHCTGNSAPWGTGDRNLMCVLLSFLLLADVCLQNTISSSRDSAYVSFLHVGSRPVLRLSSGMFSNLMCYAIDPVFFSSLWHSIREIYLEFRKAFFPWLLNLRIVPVTVVISTKR